VPGQEEAGHDGDERHYGAHREIDAAGDEHHRHAERHDAEGREVARDVAQVLGRAECRLQHSHAEHESDQRHRHPEGLGAKQLLQRRLLAHVGHLVQHGMAGYGWLGRNGLNVRLHVSLP
jgi:hypothetical protein